MRSVLTHFTNTLVFRCSCIILFSQFFIFWQAHRVLGAVLEAQIETIYWRKFLPLVSSFTVLVFSSNKLLPVVHSMLVFFVVVSICLKHANTLPNAFLSEVRTRKCFECICREGGFVQNCHSPEIIRSVSKNPDILEQCFGFLKNEWMNERMNEWMNDIMLKTSLRGHCALGEAADVFLLETDIIHAMWSRNGQYAEEK